MWKSTYTFNPIHTYFHTHIMRTNTLISPSQSPLSLSVTPTHPPHLISYVYKPPPFDHPTFFSSHPFSLILTFYFSLSLSLFEHSRTHPYHLLHPLSTSTCVYKYIFCICIRLSRILKKPENTYINQHTNIYSSIYVEHTCVLHWHISKRGWSEQKKKKGVVEAVNGMGWVAIVCGYHSNTHVPLL